MAQKYAKDQPTGFANFISKIAIVGAGGHIGKHFVEELLKTGKHNVTALTRVESTNTFPSAVQVSHINYDDEASIVSALEGQQFFIISLSVTAPPDLHSKLVKAAAKAGVPYIMPNAYGYDPKNKRLMAQLVTASQVAERIAEIEGLGVSAHIAMCCGFWYEWSLALPPPWYGFDVKNRKVTFFDDGKTKVNTSTWGQCGRALAAFLSLKELPEDENDKSPVVSSWKNEPLYISSFLISQRDMLDSLNRVLGTSDKDWTIDFEPTEKRYNDGLAEMKNGDRMGFVKAMYSRVFFPNGDGDFESTSGLHNDLIGLQKDDLDEATKRTVQMVESGWSPF
ncbi:hypothetical protein B7494_g35 [Chlorociboria aeruginascens]|nr:hypothetical protein B7494_g35 [Chlorociboria aeruginascens]